MIFDDYFDLPMIEFLIPNYPQTCHPDGGGISASSSAIKEKKTLSNSIVEIPPPSG
jgi:hypothetical protein